MSIRVVGFRKGFTVVEMITVTAVIAVLAAIVVGRLQNSRSGIQFQRGIQGIESAANKAKSQAIQTGHTYELTFDSTSQSLKVAEVEDTKNSSSPNISKTPTKTQSSSSTQTSSDAALGTGWSVSEVRKIDGTTESDLNIKFFADGTAEEKSVEFLNANAPVSLSVHQDGTIEVKRGALGDVKPKEWEAGNLEQRSQ